MKIFRILILSFFITGFLAYEIDCYAGFNQGKDSLIVRVPDPDALIENGIFEKSDTSILNQNDSLDILDSPKREKQLYELITTRKVFLTIFILIIAYFGIQLVTGFLKLLSERSTKYRITIKGIMPLVRILGWVVAITFVTMGVFKPSMGTVIAFSASIGVAIGFASQDILKNIFAGIVIIFDRPFKVGDKVEIGKYYGEIVEIGLRSTRLITPDDSLVSVPNAEIMNQSLSNSNAGEPNCQVVTEIYLPLQTDTSIVRQLAIEAAQVSKYVYQQEPAFPSQYQTLRR